MKTERLDNFLKLLHLQNEKEQTLTTISSISLASFTTILSNLRNKTKQVLKINLNKKFSKRHAARGVASTRYAAPVGGTSPSWYLTWMGSQAGEGYPLLSGKVVPPCLDLGRGYPHLDLAREYPPPGPGKVVPPPPTWTWEGGTPRRGVG